MSRLQDRREKAQAEQCGCHWDREPLELPTRTGVRPTSARCAFLEIFHEIEAVPVRLG